MSEETKRTGRNYLVSAFFAAIVIALVKWLSPNTIPFGAFEFWKPRGSITDWLVAAWPAFAWAAGVTVIFALIKTNHPNQNKYAEAHLLAGGLLSVWAGVVEEICFRWLIFLSTILWMKVINFILLGFMGWGIPEHLFIWIFRPVADFVTLHGLHAQLYHPTGWAVGGALLATNALFRDGHKYLGWIGWINSWFIGMFLFWIMFRFGLPAAILVHFLYDLIIDLIRYAKGVLGRAAGNV